MDAFPAYSPSLVLLIAGGAACEFLGDRGGSKVELRGEFALWVLYC